MKPIGTKRVPLVLPAREEWDFDLGGCPGEELEHCCFYKYALALPSVKQLLARWRRKPKPAAQKNDDFANMVRDRWFGSPFRVLLDYPEFPRKHWLQIDPEERKQRVTELPPYSSISFPSNPPKYEGPQRAHVIRLNAEMLKWQTIKQETETLLERFQEAEDMDSLPAWTKQLDGYLTEQEISDWEKRLSLLSGDEQHSAACKLLKKCKNKIQQRHRNPSELVVYEIDWTLRPDELKQRFGQWAEANRVHPPRKRSGGPPVKAVVLLRVLGAKRLLDFFRKNKGDKQSDYLCRRLHVGLNDFTIDQRKAAGRPPKSLYVKPSGWLDAEKLADEQVKELFAH